MRDITTHKVTGLNEAMAITVLDEPGPGGASHEYLIWFPYEKMNKNCSIKFQKGLIQEAGVNGISIEALLAIVRDRLEGFQSSEFACVENGQALGRVKEAMGWLAKRTKDRAARGVEGTNQP